MLGGYSIVSDLVLVLVVRVTRVRVTRVRVTRVRATRVTMGVRFGRQVRSVGVQYFYDWSRGGHVTSRIPDGSDCGEDRRRN